MILEPVKTNCPKHGLQEIVMMNNCLYCKGCVEEYNAQRGEKNE